MNCGQGITHNVLLTSFSRRCLQTLESPWTERWKRRSRSTDDVKLFAEEEDDCKEQRDKVWVKLRMHSWVYESRETWQRQKQTNESGNNPNLSFFRVIKVCSDQILFLMSSFFLLLYSTVYAHLTEISSEEAASSSLLFRYFSWIGSLGRSCVISTHFCPKHLSFQILSCVYFFFISLSYRDISSLISW